MTNHDDTLDLAQGTLLDLRLDAVRHALREHAAPEAAEEALVARFRQQKRKSARPALWWMPPLALAATVALVSWMVRAPAAKPELAGISYSAEPAPADPGPFLALKPLERIALEPGATVVSTEFPRALLAAWGLPVSPDRAGEPVRAEMLYSAEGEALAVRLIH
jgi:hypothetical protein